VLRNLFYALAVAGFIGLPGCGEDAAITVQSAGLEDSAGGYTEGDRRIRREGSQEGAMAQGPDAQGIIPEANEPSSVTSPTAPPNESLGQTPTLSTAADVPSIGAPDGPVEDSEAPSGADSGADSGQAVGDSLPGSGSVGNPAPPISSVTDVLASCATGNRSTRTVQVIFEESTSTCSYGTDGNRTRRDGVVRARAEKYVSIEIPNSELVCGISLSSQTQQIKFDDEIFLTFNDIILLSSYNYNNRFQSYANSEDADAFLFDWPRLIGGFNPGPASPVNEYCLGQGQPGAFCTIPQTQSTGAFQLQLSDRESALLGYSANVNSQAKVGFVITGDDDSSDCKHSRISLDVEITTVPAQGN
jgi:hypothetical protein